ncbi:hypothetical protein [Bacillus xiapuensis]|uniref:hypothetical protein n=1 Tax=Bacillus xiapuensis TaxID=2014075 RepID=UPI000C2381DC|nr:hypothetical protein [Bacillus xiapuensis]
MRKAYGIKSLIAYLDSVNYPLAEDEIHDLILKRELPHLRPLNNLLIFNLDDIDWWISQRRL